MDRLIKPDEQTVDVLFNRGLKCSQTFKLTNLMHTMPVAISLTTSDPQIFSFPQPFYILPPLSTSSFLVQLNKPFDQPPLSTAPATILVRSSTLPTGKAHQDDLRRLFSKPGPHIFKDATLPIYFVGPQAAEFLLTSSFETMYSVFSKAISCCDESQLTCLLRVAAVNGNSHFISALIEAGADVNDRDPEGESVMSLAVKSGKADAVRVLIQSGYVMDDKIDRFLHVAAAMNKADIMENLCLGYVDIDLDSVNSLGQTALHLAAIHGQVEALQFLVSVGSNVDSTDRFGWTPLHYAAQEGHFEAVEFLLNHSVYSKYAVTKEGQTAFALAVERGNLDLYDSLCLGDLLQRAARIDDVHAIKSCLARGADVNGKDQNGWTPLHRAAFKGHIESVKVLVSSQGARVDVVDGSGYTPLLRAVEAGNVEVAVYLLSRGAKTGLKSLDGRLPCDIECLKNHPSLVIPLDQVKERD
ncbi:hypothetical protein Salat_2233900 [Sesamum alatum]|uniref:MSP domain-containing protein n=1 Tax=Sesamum alatum TaxID=300844 RepID=A0AAE1XV73_9LAMI|nr:hypothetical protein Salat_2233900 [Sesamum alatum]